MIKKNYFFTLLLDISYSSRVSLCLLFLNRHTPGMGKTSLNYGCFTIYISCSFDHHTLGLVKNPLNHEIGEKCSMFLKKYITAS